MTRVEARLFTPAGQARDVITGFSSQNGPGIEYILSAGSIDAALTLAVPRSRPLQAVLERDLRIGVFRETIPGGRMTLDGDAIWLLRKVSVVQDEIILSAVHANSLLSRRIVAYDAGTTYSNKNTSTYADALIKAFVRENMGSLFSSSARDGDDVGVDLSAYMSIDGDSSNGVAMVKAASRALLSDVVIDICASSTQQGTYMVAEIVGDATSALTFRTYVNQRGLDRSADSTRPMIFSQARKNVENLTIEQDWSTEVTVAYAAGTGRNDERLVEYAQDTTRLTASPFNRIERLLDYSNVDLRSDLQALAQAAVREGRPKTVITGNLVTAPGSIRGLDYDFGDLVTVETDVGSFDVRLDMIQVSLTPSGYQEKALFRGEV